MKQLCFSSAVRTQITVKICKNRSLAHFRFWGLTAKGYAPICSAAGLRWSMSTGEEKGTASRKAALVNVPRQKQSFPRILPLDASGGAKSVTALGSTMRVSPNFTDKSLKLARHKGLSILCVNLFLIKLLSSTSL